MVSANNNGYSGPTNGERTAPGLLRAGTMITGLQNASKIPSGQKLQKRATLHVNGNGQLGGGGSGMGGAGSGL